MKKQFYGSRGLKSSGQLSFKNLTVDDVEAYKNFLLAIKEKYESNTYLNPEKYEEFREKMRQQFEETYSDINQAIEREKKLKKWRREKKDWIISTLNPEKSDLSIDFSTPCGLSN